MVLGIESINSRGVLEASKNSFDIKFSSSSDATLSFDDNLEITLHANQAMNVKDMVSFDELENILTVKSDKLADFINLLKQSDDQIELGISGYDSYGNDISKEIVFYYGYGSIAGTLVDDGGNAYVGLEGETIELRGAFKSKTYETTIKSDSSFEFIDLPADTYNLNLITDDFKIAVGSVLVNTSSPDTSISPEVVDLKISDLSSARPILELPQEINAASPERLKHHYESINSFRARNIQNRDGDLIGSVTTSSASEGASISKKEIFEIPKEITQVTIVSTIESAEFPTYTTAQSKFNDAWHYNYLVGAKVESKQGNVNSTHASAGTVSYPENYEVNSDPESPAQKVTLFASATNIGDSILATSVTLDIYEASAELTINDFSHKEGLGLGKTGRWHIGIGSTSQKQWKANVIYSPKDSDLSKAECKFRTSGSEITVDNVSITKTNPGEAELQMGFSGIIPPTLGSTHGKIECDFEAIDSGDNIIATNQPSNMEMTSGKDDLIPLSRYSTGSRYGTRDTGGDSWMRDNTRQFMAASDLVYNDASREHGGCFVKDSQYSSYNISTTACSKALRDHSSHRDGTSVDTRYPTTTMNNPIAAAENFRAKLGQASSDAAALKEVKDWVLEARNGIDSITSDNKVKKVYVVKANDVKWLHDLLYKGVNESGALVDGLSPWTSKSAKVGQYKGHANHIHVEFYPLNN